MTEKPPTLNYRDKHARQPKGPMEPRRSAALNFGIGLFVGVIVTLAGVALSPTYAGTLRALGPGLFANVIAVFLLAMPGWRMFAAGVLLSMPTMLLLLAVACAIIVK